MSGHTNFKKPLWLRISHLFFISFWVLLATFPLIWILVMSFKIPLDAFSNNPLQVIFGYETKQSRKGFSFLSLGLTVASSYFIYYWIKNKTSLSITFLKKKMNHVLAWLCYFILISLDLFIFYYYLLPFLIQGIEKIFNFIPVLNYLAQPVWGITFEHYYAVWIENAFYKNFINSLIITLGVVSISLFMGTLGGYALARRGGNLAFWLLIIALIFRALPHSVLVTGYLPPFINSKEILAPFWESNLTNWFFSLFNDIPPTFYGARLPVVIVLVAINQPFTIWMLRSFFMNIPTELDEAAQVDGCSHFKAFRLVIMPVMWPGVITTGLFSFLLAYNDYLVTSLLLDFDTQTMVPAITHYFNRETTSTDEIEAVAAAVSIIIPLFFLVLAFQKQIVSGLVQGAIKE